MPRLDGAVAVVAGATRGAGRGIAAALGEAGATVYCTGRSTRGNPSPLQRPETLEETAELVSAVGGRGIALRVDHTEEEQVAALFQRVGHDAKRLDVLVNVIWGGEVSMLEWFFKPFWETNLEQGFALMRQAVFSHLITAKHAAALMVPRRRGLIVELTDGDTLAFRGSVFYDLTKTTLIRLAYIYAEELHRHRVTALAVTPGFMRTEMILEMFGVTEANWRDAAKKDRFFQHSETPRYAGRGIAALAADPKVFLKSGQVTSSWELMREYGFEDTDGRRPDMGRAFRERLPRRHGFQTALARSNEWQRRLLETAAGYLTPGPKTPRRRGVTRT